MPSKPAAACRPLDRRRAAAAAARTILAIAFLGGLLAAPHAEARPAAAVLLDRMCAQTLKANEVDRLFGTISLTVRTTIKYQRGVFSPDLIDDSIQDALIRLLDACKRLAAAPDVDRLGIAVELIRAATLKRLHDPHAHYSARQTEKATAADLSQELSATEIDAWLDGLPARQRALALFLYASNVTTAEIGGAVGLPPAAVRVAFAQVKTNLLRFFRAQWDNAPPPPFPPSPAMQYTLAGVSLASLLKPAKPGGPASAASPGSPAVPTTGVTARVTGISRDIYAGWSLLAAVSGLGPDRNLELYNPILLVPDKPGRRRMIVTAFDEIGDPHDKPRRFLLKAYAIDADKDGSGLQDGFHLGAARIANRAALAVLGSRALASIEIARCLWYDYGTADDPGGCPPAPPAVPIATPPRAAAASVAVFR